MDFSARYVEVGDLPYCSEPDLFYWRRMKAGLRVRELRESACRLFGKQNDQLTVRDLKLAFLKMCPIKVNLGGDDQVKSLILGLNLFQKRRIRGSMRPMVAELQNVGSDTLGNYFFHLFRRVAGE